MSFYGAPEGRRVTMRDLAEAKARGEKWPMITAYDALTARIFDEAGIPALLVGDSAAMVVYGHDSTLPVTVDELVPLVRAVVRGSSRALVIADLPFGSYQASAQQALETAARFMKEAGVQAVKLEGGVRSARVIEAVVKAGIPVVGHIGWTPQAANTAGKVRVQGKDKAQARALLADALAVQEAGAFAIVLELVPAGVAAQVTAELRIPTIGIGAGPACDGQVLVLHDLLGVYPGRVPKFARNFMDGAPSIRAAIEAYVAAVQSRAFPAPEHSF